MVERYVVRKALISNVYNTKEKRYFIIDNENGLPVHLINKYLYKAGIRSINTNRKYAGHICVWLNYLNMKNKLYCQATLKDVLNFIDFKIFELDENKKVINYEGPITYSTLSGYITALTELYKCIEGLDDASVMEFKTKEMNANKSYYYGQIYSYDYKYIVEERIRSLKQSREYIKWYTKDEIIAIASNFNTIRDKAIFLTTYITGMRIDEVISIILSDFKQEENTVTPSRSKSTGENANRILFIGSALESVYNNYLWNERLLVESETDCCDYLFINLRKDNNRGKPIKYRSYIDILKRTAKRAGIDAEKIRTHSGRSTHTMDLLYWQAEHPEDPLTDEQIRLIMGWSSTRSIDLYKKHRDIRLAKESAKKAYGRDVEYVPKGVDDDVMKKIVNNEGENK